MAGTGLFGRIGELKLNEGPFAYVGWIEMFFIANSIVEQPAERNKAVNRVIRQRKITKIGLESNSTLRNLMVPLSERDTHFLILWKH